MRKELELFFARQPVGTTEVVTMRKGDTGLMLVGALYKCSKADWRYMIQMGVDVPVGQLMTPGVGLRVGFALVRASIYAWIRTRFSAKKSA